MTARVGSSPRGAGVAAVRAARPGRPILALGLAGLLASLTACTEQTLAQFPTQSKLPDEDRRPDGIAVDLSSDPPPLQNEAEADDSIVTLRTPLGTEVALQTVRTFFEAMVVEDVSAMSMLIRANAINEDTRSGSRRRSLSILNLWRDRFRKREYQKLATRLVYREADVMTYRSDQLAALPLAARLRTPTPTSEGSNDLVLRVPIITHTVKNERLLGDEIFFWLERRDDGYVIAQMAENVPF